jgi:hypothetical protein
MKLQAKGKLKKKLEEEAEVVFREAEQPAYYKGEVSTREIRNVWADEVEAIYGELGLEINRPSAEDKALTIIRHMRMKAKVKFSEVDNG